MLYCAVASDYEERSLTIGKKHHLFPSEPTSYKLLMNYRPINILIHCSQNVNSILLMNTFHSSSSDIEDECENNDFCISISGCGNLNQIISTCTDSIWVYIDPAQDSEVTLEASYIPNTSCNAIPEDKYTFCGAMDYNSCNRCEGDCRLAECIGVDRSDYSTYTVLSLCLPFSTSSDEVSTRCLAHKDVENAQWKQECKDSLFIDEVGWKNVIIVMVVTALYVSIVIVVGWYHWYYKQDGRPPIKCCKFCPKILFPDKERVIERRNREGVDLEMRYRSI